MAGSAMTSTLPSTDHRGRGDSIRAHGYIRKHFLMNTTELANARKLIVEAARSRGVQLVGIHIEEIETSPEAFHDLLAVVMQEAARMIITPDIQHLEVAGEPSSVRQRLESNGITIVVGDQDRGRKDQWCGCRTPQPSDSSRCNSCATPANCSSSIDG
jgi:hypothetical protein